MSPGRRQVIIWTNAGLLSIGTLRTNFIEILSEIYAFSFKKMHLKTSSAKWRPLCFGFNVLTVLKWHKAIFQKTFEWHSVVRIFRLYLGLRLFITHIHFDGIPWIDGLVTWLFNKQLSCRWFEMPWSSCYRILMGWTLRTTYLSRFHATDSYNTFDKRYAFSLPIQYTPRNMHTVLLCFALLWLCNRS